MYIFTYNKGLDKKLLKDITEQKYSTQDILKIHAELKECYLNKEKGFLAVSMIAVICVLFICIMEMSYMDMMGVIISALVLIVVLGLALGFVKVNGIEKSKNQFVKAVTIGYPELIEKVGADSFR